MTADRAEILSLLASAAQGLTLAEIAAALDVTRGRRPQLRQLLLQLLRQGDVRYDGRAYQLRPSSPAAPEEEPPPTCGVLHVTQHGRGFVDLGEAYDEVLVEAPEQGAAIDGDTVELQTWDGSNRREGRVVRVVAHGRARLTGTLRGSDLEPDDVRLRLRVEVLDAGPARPRAKRPETVLAEIVEYPERRGGALRVRVVRVLGEAGRVETEVARAVAGAGVDDLFPPEVEAEAAAMVRGVAVGPEQLRDRLDLRSLRFVTIDPSTARDFDDAVAVEDGPGGTTRVWVAVADVSAYVPEGSALDREARRRGCSLYLPDRAIPMLPAALSSGTCSLVPDEDRLAMVVRLDVAPDGLVRGSDCAAAVIHSHGRLDYGSVAAALHGDFRGRRAGYVEHVEQLERLQAVAATLHRRRLARGALDLDLPEAQVVLDEDDPTRVRDIVQSRADAPVKRAYNLIEELMVAANEAVGRRFAAADLPTIWRVHPPPGAEALAHLAVVLSDYGVPVREGELHAEAGMARLLQRLAGHRAARPLCYLVLRALSQATYSTTNVGHFGLASETYLHFTSPIRRYPDLHVHRLVKAMLRADGKPAGGPGEVQSASPVSPGDGGCGGGEGRTGARAPREALQAVARESTAAERRTIEVEREVASLYAASLMRDRIGDVRGGTICGLTSFGFFVALDEPCVEGLVRSDRLRDWLELDGEHMRLAGRDSGRVYSLGDRVRVRVVDAGVARRQIDLELLPGEESHEPDPLAARGDPYRRGRGRRDGRGADRRGQRERTGQRRGLPHHKKGRRR